MRDRASPIRHDSRMGRRDHSAIPPQGVIDGAQTSTTTLAPGPVLDRNVELVRGQQTSLGGGAPLTSAQISHVPDGRLSPRWNVLRKKSPRGWRALSWDLSS